MLGRNYYSEDSKALHCCAEKQWVPHLWRSSRSGTRRGPGQPNGGWQLCPWQEGWTWQYLRTLEILWVWTYQIELQPFPFLPSSRLIVEYKEVISLICLYIAQKETIWIVLLCSILQVRDQRVLTQDRLWYMINPVALIKRSKQICHVLFSKHEVFI